MNVCLVTGASSGIGLATAVHLARRGFVVYGAARRVELMEPLRAVGGQAIAMDITDDDAIERAVETILNDHGRIDALVNNAGMSAHGAIEDTPIATARRLFEVNLFGLARLTQLVVPTMREQRSGTIVNVSSIGGEIALPLGAWYYASKHALEAFSDSLRQEVGRFGIRVVIVQPGIIKTGFENDTPRELIAVSGTGAYRTVAKAMAERAEEAFRPDSRATDPGIIAGVIRQAIESPRPKARYAAGHLAGTLLALNRFLPATLFDRIATARDTPREPLG